MRSSYKLLSLLITLRTFLTTISPTASSAPPQTEVHQFPSADNNNITAPTPGREEALVSGARELGTPPKCIQLTIDGCAGTTAEAKVNGVFKRNEGSCGASGDWSSWYCEATEMYLFHHSSYGDLWQFSELCGDPAS